LRKFAALALLRCHATIYRIAMRTRFPPDGSTMAENRRCCAGNV
jgi:hypothetical protein